MDLLIRTKNIFDPNNNFAKKQNHVEDDRDFSLLAKKVYVIFLETQGIKKITTIATSIRNNNKKARHEIVKTYLNKINAEIIPRDIKKMKIDKMRAI